MWPSGRRGFQAKGRARAEAGTCLKSCSKNKVCSVAYLFFFFFLLMGRNFSFNKPKLKTFNLPKEFSPWPLKTGLALAGKAPLRVEGKTGTAKSGMLSGATGRMQLSPGPWKE